MNDLRRKLKELLIERLKFEDMTADDIADDEALFDGGLGLDSIDALEIVVMLESEFGIRVKSEGSARDNFRSISALADFEARIAQVLREDGPVFATLHLEKGALSPQLDYRRLDDPARREAFKAALRQG